MRRSYISASLLTATCSWAMSQTAPVSSPASAAPGLVVVSPLDYQVIQRKSMEAGTLNIKGRCGVACDQLEWRAQGKDFKGTALDPGWRNLPMDPATFSFNAPVTLPAGGWYALEIRAVKAGQPVAQKSIAHVGVGEVFISAGQSNSTSCGGLNSKSPLDGRTKPLSGMVSSFDGNVWGIANDPQPGSHDIKVYAAGSFYPAFGDALFAKYHVPVGVAVTGHGATSVNQWQPEGELFNWTLTRLKQLGPNGFRAMLWHQGESDADKMKEEDYAAKLSTTLDGWRKQAGWDFPVFVAQASFRPWGGNSAAVRAAQQSLWDKKIAYPGPDTDAMLGDLRDNDGKGIHFSLKGLKVHGEAWAEKVGAYLDRVGLASIGATKPENAEVVAEPSERAPK